MKERNCKCEVENIMKEREERKVTYRRKEYVIPSAGPRTGMTTPTQAKSGKNLTEIYAMSKRGETTVLRKIRA